MGPLPDAVLDESCVAIADPRIPVEDVLDEQSSSQCLTFSTDARTDFFLVNIAENQKRLFCVVTASPYYRICTQETRSCATPASLG